MLKFRIKFEIFVYILKGNVEDRCKFLKRIPLFFPGSYESDNNDKIGGRTCIRRSVTSSYKKKQI